MGGQKHSMIVIEPRQRQEPPVSFHNTYSVLKHITYRFLRLLKSKNTINYSHIGIDRGMSTMGDVSCRHPNHSSRANISQTTLVE